MKIESLVFFFFLENLYYYNVINLMIHSINPRGLGESLKKEPRTKGKLGVNYLKKKYIYLFNLLKRLLNF